MNGTSPSQVSAITTFKLATFVTLLLLVTTAAAFLGAASR
jgi:hypothetical protein